jgi:hypothetical protein
MWAEMAAKSTMPLWAATPNEEEPGGGVADNARFTRGVFIPSEGSLAFLKYHAQISLAFRVQTGIEVCVRFGVPLPAGYEEYLSEHLDRVLGKVRLAQKGDAQLVVANDVPAVQSMLITQVRDELGDGHASSCPWDDTFGIHLENVGHQTAHSQFFSIEPMQEICIFDGPEWIFALFKAPGFWNRVTLKERIEMAIHFHCDASDVGGDLMGGPSVA